MKKTVKYLVENGGASISEAMRQGGYSPATAKTPQKLTESKGFQSLVDEVMPDRDLLALHREGLSATLVKTAQFEGSITDEKEYADYPTRHKYLETAYKIKGRLEAENSDNIGDINISLTLYANDKPDNSISVSAKTVPVAVPRSDGRRIQASRNSLAQAQREGQDSSSGSD